MKQILIIVSIIISQLAVAQDTLKNFHIVNRASVQWFKIYASQTKYAAVIDAVKQSGLFEKIDIDSTRIMARLLPFDADYRGAGYTMLNTPIYIQNSRVNAFVVITPKPNGYEVSVRKIELHDKDGSTGLENYALKRNKTFTNGFKYIPSTILNYSFTKLFETLLR